MSAHFIVCQFAVCFLPSKFPTLKKETKATAAPRAPRRGPMRWALMLAIIAIAAGRPVERRDRQLQAQDPTEMHPSTARRRMGNTTKLQAPGPKCASYPVVGGKTNCPKDRCLFAGWFCAPLPTGHTVGSKADACEVQRSETQYPQQP